MRGKFRNNFNQNNQTQNQNQNNSKQSQSHQGHQTHLLAQHVVGRNNNRKATLLVSNLHYQATEGDLMSLFSFIGTVLSARIQFDKSGRSLGLATVVFVDPRDAKKAMQKYDGVMLDEIPISIKLADDSSASDDEYEDVVDDEDAMQTDHHHAAAGHQQRARGRSAPSSTSTNYASTAVLAGVKKGNGSGGIAKKQSNQQTQQNSTHQINNRNSRSSNTNNVHILSRVGGNGIKGILARVGDKDGINRNALILKRLGPKGGVLARVGGPVAAPAEGGASTSIKKNAGKGSIYNKGKEKGKAKA
jgi:RNA recognition motif-containing protein